MKIRGKAAGDDLNFYAMLGVLQSGMWLQSDIESYLGSCGLSHGRFSILLSLTDTERDGLIGNELAVQLGVAKPTIARMIQKLIDDDYLTFASEQRDLRTKRYSLTKKAKDLLQRIIPGYLLRLRVMSAGLTDTDKKELIGILSRINFLDPRKMIIRTNEDSVGETAEEIRKLCDGGSPEDIDRVMAFLDETATLPVTKIIDFHLGTVGSIEGVRRIEYYLFHGTQMQRNYCTLFFARRNDWRLVKSAYERGLIDSIQAYAR